MDTSGHHFRRSPCCAVVGLLVSRRGTRRRRIHRATHLQRERRTQRLALRSMVQPGPLRAASLALDIDSTRRRRPLSEPGAARTRVHAGSYSPDSARAPGNPTRWIYGRLHVHGRHATQLGQFLPDRRFLPALSEERGKRSTFCECLTVGYCFPRGRCRRGRLATEVRFRWVENCSRTRRWHWRCLLAPLVLVARQCLE